MEQAVDSPVAFTERAGALSTFFGTHRVILAPMAGVGDVAFRQLSLEQGADLTYTEMVSAMGLSHGNAKTRNLLALAPNEREVVVQLFGHDAATMAREAEWLCDCMEGKLAYLDINMGCPARKIVSKGDGSALMRDPERAASIVSAVAEASSIPVTVKFRRGFAEGDETAVEFGKRMEQAGASALAVHGRFSKQFYHGKADWGVIGRVRAAVGIPVIGNGDVVCGDDAVRMVRETGCDAVMIGRGAQGNPWVFADVKGAFAGEQQPMPPTAFERLEMAKRHAQLLSEREGRNIVRMRKHAMHYIAGMPGAARARGLINKCTSFEDFAQVFDELERIDSEHELVGKGGFHAS